MSIIEKELKTYCELHWWNMGKKTLDFKGELQDLLKSKSIKFTKRKTEYDGLFTFHFKNRNGISFKARGQSHDFPHLAKQFIQMELVRLGDKSELYVECFWRPKVTVNK